jgi:peroxiredoxin
MNILRNLRFSSDHVVLLTLLAGSLGLNVYLGTELRAHRHPPQPPSLMKGEALPALEVRSVEGEATSLRFDGDRPTVLYVLRPSCPWCQKNSRSIASLHAAVQDRYRFLSLSLDDKGVEEFLAKARLPFPTYVASGGALAGKVQSVPATFVLAGNGTVLEAWNGAYAGPTKSSIEKYFGVPLPRVE